MLTESDLNFSQIMHIHSSSPNSSLSEDDAAVKIQAGWKGYRVRKQLRNSRKSKGSQQNGHGGSSRRKSSENSTIEERSAVKIQAGWKGFKIRRELKCAREAATKIQASFRGFRIRKELKGKPSKD